MPPDIARHFRLRWESSRTSSARLRRAVVGVRVPQRVRIDAQALHVACLFGVVKGWPPVRLGTGVPVRGEPLQLDRFRCKQFLFLAIRPGP